MEAVSCSEKLKRVIETVQQTILEESNLVL